ncbi:hypothetical protein [Lysobacter sp. F6437]|uniref:hypothetical protein n=1 Tax=Lysobacter sp. F6437 TaxID=3459296 RepID=UPI00403DD6E6
MNSSPCPTPPSPPRLRPHALASMLLATLCAAPFAFAQQAGERIEQQMTHEQFVAAGLDQLSAEQLRNLNAWLNRTLVTETTKAATEATRQAQQDVGESHHGFLGSSSDEPVAAQLQGEFHGFAKGRQYQLDNGQVWRQTDASSLVGVRLDSPKVTIKPSLIGSAWYLKVEGYNTAAKVERVK